MKKQLTFFLLFIAVLSGYAQQVKTPEAKAYDSLMIHHYSETRWMIGNRVINKKELHALLRSNPASSAVYEKAHKNRITSQAMSYASLGVLFASFFVLPENPELGFALMGTSLVVSGGSIPFFIKGDRGLQEAVWLYNRAILTGDTISRRPPVVKN
jgi:hypothetical protein